jgi:hypothetical protein
MLCFGFRILHRVLVLGDHLPETRAPPPTTWMSPMVQLTGPRHTKTSTYLPKDAACARRRLGNVPRSSTCSSPSRRPLSPGVNHTRCMLGISLLLCHSDAHNPFPTINTVPPSETAATQGPHHFLRAGLATGDSSPTHAGADAGSAHTEHGAAAYLRPKAAGADMQAAPGPYPGPYPGPCSPRQPGKLPCWPAAAGATQPGGHAKQSMRLGWHRLLPHGPSSTSSVSVCRDAAEGRGSGTSDFWQLLVPAAAAGVQWVQWQQQAAQQQHQRPWPCCGGAAWHATTVKSSIAGHRSHGIWQCPQRPAGCPLPGQPAAAAVAHRASS